MKIRNMILCGLISICLVTCGVFWLSRLTSSTEEGSGARQEEVQESQQNPVRESSHDPVQESSQNSIQTLPSDTDTKIEADTGTASFSITMLDVGQGLSLLIQADGHTMLYDGGGRETSSYVVAYLKNHGFESLDYMIASHYDEDHIAGLIGCLRSFPTGTVLCPDYETDTDIYASFEKRLTASGAGINHPSPGDTYSLGDALITILGPSSFSAQADNNNSIVLRIDYGEFSCLISGDAEREEENEILKSGADLDVDLYVAGHHGSQSSSTQDFLDAMTPDTVWISCGEGNAYGHPAASTMESLQERNIDIYRTDLQGEVTLTSDGRTCTYSKLPSTDYSAGTTSQSTRQAEDSSGNRTGSSNPAENTEKEKAGSSNQAEDSSGELDYIVNISSLKFHLPDCPAVDKMSDSNKKTVHSTREELIAQGYSPCGYCNP